MNEFTMEKYIEINKGISISIRYNRIDREHVHILFNKRRLSKKLTL